MKEQLNRMNDYYFKYLMGKEKNKALALDFINAVLATEDHFFTDIIYVNKDEDPDHAGDKLSRLDIKGKLNDGSIIELEMQALSYDSMSERSLYYWARMYSGMIKAGEDYATLKPAISVIILGYEHFKEEPHWHNEYQLLNIRNHKALTQDLRIVFLELPKLKDKDVDINNKLELWCAYFGRKIADSKLKEVGNMASVLQAELEFTADEREQWKYEQREKFLHDEATRRYEAKVALEKAVKEGTAQGIAQGIAQGMAQGMAQGIAQGMAQGVLKGKLEDARAMKQDKLPIELIMKYTGLTAEQIANA